MNEPLAQRLRPKTLADVCGQRFTGQTRVLLYPRFPVLSISDLHRRFRIDSVLQGNHHDSGFGFLL